MNFPIYAPYKHSIIIPKLIVEHALKLEKKAQTDLITHDERGLSIHDPDGLLTRVVGIQPQSYEYKTQLGNKIASSTGGFKSINLTYLPERPDSINMQFYKDENSQLRSFLFLPDDNWRWRPDSEAEIFKTFVEQFNLEKIHLVRLIYLSPPAVGGVHIDASESAMKKYYNLRHGVSLTVNLLAGGGQLHFRVHDQVKNSDQGVDIWHFNPSVPHAVGNVTQKRIQLRIFGSLKNEHYLERLDLEKAIWS